MENFLPDQIISAAPAIKTITRVVDVVIGIHYLGQPSFHVVLGVEILAYRANFLLLRLLSSLLPRSLRHLLFVSIHRTWIWHRVCTVTVVINLLLGVLISSAAAGLRQRYHRWRPLQWKVLMLLSRARQRIVAPVAIYLWTINTHRMGWRYCLYWRDLAHGRASKYATIGYMCHIRIWAWIGCSDIKRMRFSWHKFY